jgi:hypothetical protein
MDEAERKMRERGQMKLFMERIRKEDPVRATLYCDHGFYIGFGGLFRNKCEDCVNGS